MFASNEVFLFQLFIQEYCWIKFIKKFKVGLLFQMAAVWRGGQELSGPQGVLLHPGEWDLHQVEM